jgi:transposase
MATPNYWAEATHDRQRTHVFYPTLDAMIAPDDPVRFVDEVLFGMDWSKWEAAYERKRGQPPIHPRYIAAAILYGLYRGIRSSRKLEEACRYRLDFMWLVEGRVIDHTTFSKFRTRFRDELKDLFRQIGRMAMTLGLIRLGVVAFDGTRVKANNSRFRTRTAKTLEAKLEALDELFEQLVTQMQTVDGEQAAEGSPTQLPEDLADVAHRREQIRQALEQAKAADEARRRQGIDPKKNPAQVPITDPDSHVMPNKEGGYSPNYTPVATTDGESGFIVDVDVLSSVNESEAAAASVDRIEEVFGQKPEKFLTDAGNNAAPIIVEMEERGVEFYVPIESQQPGEGSPAKRDDPRQPIPESEWGNLERNNAGKLAKMCFVYVPEEDQYYCPMGNALRFSKADREQRCGKPVAIRVYQCGNCEGCPLAAACLSPQAKHGRTVRRDEYEEVRERTAARMSSASAKAIYKQRQWIAETTFGILKSIMGLRQFLLRGLEKVKTEWLWAATAFNLMKLARQIGTLRAETAKCAVEA